jgi:oxygen-independent coproporphyrinogen-3 oxidase
MHLIESLYIHFPFCKHLCNYCDFYKSIPQNFSQDLETFHSLFEKQWKIHQELLSTEQAAFSKLKTLYIGGGTPSLWKEDGALFLRKFLAEKNLNFASDYEFTLEVNPATWTDEGIRAWLESGVNRFSIGVQSYREEFIKLLDRVHDLGEVKKTLEYFSHQKVNFSADLMLGLPHSRELKRDVLLELKEMLEFEPSHFSVYILTVKPQYKLFSDLPDESYIEEEYLKVAEFLSLHGFGHYEVSNYSLPGKESLHNLQYWKGSSVAALGPSATGFINQGERALRYKWKTSDSALEKEPLTLKELNFEKLYLALRTKVGLEISHLNPQNRSIVENWIGRNLAIQENQKIYLNSRGFLLLDSLILELN